MSLESAFLTKKRIAKTLKNSMREKTFEQISITEIMKSCQTRRQTFYNYFLDKYDLVSWIFETDLKEQVSDNFDYISAERLIENLFYFLEENKHFYLHMLELEGQNSFKSYFNDYCISIMKKYVAEHLSGTYHPSEADCDFFCRYHGLALASYLHESLKKETFQPKIECRLLCQTLTGSFTSLTQK